MQPVNSAKHVDVRGVGLSQRRTPAILPTYHRPSVSAAFVSPVMPLVVVVAEYPTRRQKHYVGQSVLDSSALASAHWVWSVGLGQRHEWTFLGRNLMILTRPCLSVALRL